MIPLLSILRTTVYKPPAAMYKAPDEVSKTIPFIVDKDELVARPPFTAITGDTSESKHKCMDDTLDEEELLHIE